ncbi:unnamed protein product [Paramecium octaurelia]|uniref:Uncharacterized protein n=1 Tax=Paramecium octaurelia TaxID=43137 RepID=A0A8S1UM94_PAROT|nr:unnamed protein product [Paramecium octaurelia]CAD8164812.1 unnamed protein product [Paramecium octaurelia]
MIIRNLSELLGIDYVKCIVKKNFIYIIHNIQGFELQTYFDYSLKLISAFNKESILYNIH